MSSLLYLATILDKTMYIADKISYYCDRVMGFSRSCLVQCKKNDSPTFHVECLTFSGPYLAVFYALSTETDYTWDNITKKMRDFGINPEEPIMSSSGTYSLTQYIDENNIKKAGFYKNFDL